MVNIAFIFFFKASVQSFDWIRILVQVFDHSPIVMHSSRYLHILLLRRYQIELNTTNQIISFIKQKYTNIAERFPFFNACVLQSPVHVACTVVPPPLSFPSISYFSNQPKTRNKKQKSQHNAPQNYFVNWKMGNTIQR